MRYLIIFIYLFISIPGSAQFIAEEKVLDHSGLLKGTLILPANKARFNLVVLQAGSGPTDRNGNSPLGVNANSYRLLAEGLAEKNIATLTTDKRGIAASTSAGKKEADLRFETYAEDMVAWIQLMRKDPRVKKIFIAGHSEGSLIGMLAAQLEKTAGFISLAGAGESIDKIMVFQVERQSPALAHTMDSLLTRLRNKEKLDKVPADLFSVLRPSIQPYMASWMMHDPCGEIKKVTGRVLIIQGTTDIQVERKQGEQLKACRPDATLRIIKGMNHILKEAPEDLNKNRATYADRTLPLMPGLVDAIAKFVKK